MTGTFIKYCKQEWIQKNPNWYEGAYSNLPSTNNALESFNRKIKDEYMLRERLPLGRFIIHSLEYINQWSQDYLKEVDPKTLAEEPHLTVELWTNAYQWVKTNKESEITILYDISNRYLLPAKDYIWIYQIQK